MKHRLCNTFLLSFTASFLLSFFCADRHAAFSFQLLSVNGDGREHRAKFTLGGGSSCDQEGVMKLSSPPQQQWRLVVLLQWTGRSHKHPENLWESYSLFLSVLYIPWPHFHPPIPGLLSPQLSFPSTLSMASPAVMHLDASLEERQQCMPSISVRGHMWCVRTCECVFTSRKPKDMMGDGLSVKLNDKDVVLCCSIPPVISVI